MSLLYNKVHKKLVQNNQQHLLRFYDDLDEVQQQDFLHHLNNIEFDDINDLFSKAMCSLDEQEDSKCEKNIEKQMEPIPESQFQSEEKCNEKLLKIYRDTGLKEISQGHVGVLLMAGGQGTRLGVSHPKGMYSVGLPSGKTLFQLQAERIRRLQYLARQQFPENEESCIITWYIMTSGPTHEETIEYLEANNYFGLNKEDVVLFKQGLLPCFTKDGKVILDEKNKVALAPDGNGGIYRSLDKNGILKDMEERGVKHIHAHSVDNILVKVADPLFIGYCVNKNACAGAKVVRKASPTEPVGVVCKVNGVCQVVEYSEISDETANLRTPKGQLVFSAGNICNHYFKVDFLKEVATKYESKLKIHVAEKKIPYVDLTTGERQRPKSPNGIKLEKFVFDVFPFAKNFQTWEVPRCSEFSALKNANDAKKDCPKTARRDLLFWHKKIVEQEGGVVYGEVEISPLLSYAGEGLSDIVMNKKFDLHMSVHLRSDEEIMLSKTKGAVNGF